jgi:hypothetical protein
MQPIKSPAFLLVLTVAAIPIASCQCRPGVTAITASVKEGSQYCSIVHIPQPWDLPFDYAGGTAVYRLPAQGDAFLFSLQNPFVGRSTPIAQKYRIDLVHRGVIRSAIDSEWEAGKDIQYVPTSTEPLKLDGPEPLGLPIVKDNRTLTVNGHLLPKSGDIWMGFPRIRTPYIVLTSFNGWWAEGKAANDGPFFIDVYQPAAGKRLGLIRGHWCLFTPDGALNRLRWISNRDLVFPFGFETRDIVVCRFE